MRSGELGRKPDGFRISRLLRPADVVVFVMLAASAVFMIWAGSGSPRAEAAVEVTVSGETVYQGQLGQDWRYEAQGPLGKTVVVCQSGAVWVQDSPCPAKLCVRRGKITRPGEMIVCVPNRVVVRIVGLSGVDAVSM